MKHQTMGIQEWGLLFTLAALWGGSFIFNEMALEELRPFTLVAGRVGLGGLLLLGVVTLSGHKMPKSWRMWGAFAVMGALNNVLPFSMIVWGQQYIEGGLAAILNSTTPLFSIILMHFVSGGERITVNRLAGIGLGIVGVVVLIGPETLAGLSSQGMGQLAILGASLSYACSAIYGRRFRGLSPLVSSAGMLVSSTVMIIPLALLIERPWEMHFGPSVVGAVIGLAVLSTMVAYLIYFRLLSTAGPTNLLLVTLLVPISALTLGGLFLGERLSGLMLVGMLLIFSGLISIDGRLLRLVRTTGKREKLDTV